MLHGVAKAGKGGELISGDNFTIHEGAAAPGDYGACRTVGAAPSGKGRTAKVWWS